MNSTGIKRTRHRGWLMAGLLAVIGLGLASRAYPHLLPACLGKYPGDALWALMVFIGWAIVMPGAAAWRMAACALVTSFAIEFSQLYKAGWIDAIRATTMGHLVLGSTFAWRDLVAYVWGIGMGVAADLVVNARRPALPAESGPVQAAATGSGHRSP